MGKVKQKTRARGGENKARSGLFKEQAGITLRDNSCLLYEVNILIVNCLAIIITIS
jgi:hypothetical protein